MKKGLFITFEGADGSGKTTQLKKIGAYLESQNYDIVETIEPGAEGVGQQIRQIVLHHKGIVSDNCELFLYIADRAQHVDTFIKPLLAENKIILCDRYIDSTVAYQGYGREKNIEEIKYLNKLATSDLLPDLTIVFDVDTDIAQTRVGSEKDRLESAGIEFHKKVRQGYLDLADQNPERIKVIDANRSIESVYNDTKDTIIKLINKNYEE